MKPIWQLRWLLPLNSVTQLSLPNIGQNRPNSVQRSKPPDFQSHIKINQNLGIHVANILLDFKHSPLLLFLINLVRLDQTWIYLDKTFVNITMKFGLKLAVKPFKIRAVLDFIGS